MISSFITSSRLEYFIKSNDRVPRERFVDYFKNLYQLYGSSISNSSFMEGGQFDYTNMGVKLLDEFKKNNDLSGYDALLSACWAYEFDPEYASCLPYFLNKYRLDSNIFDFSDVGTLSSISALKLITQMQKKEISNKVLLLALEQTTIPRDVEEYDLVPIVDGGALLSIEASSEPLKNSLRICAADSISEQDIIENKKSIHGIASDIVAKHSVGNDQVTIFFEKASYSYKSYKYELGRCQKSDFNVGFYDYRPGILPPVELLSRQLRLLKSMNRYLLIFIEDKESLDLGYMLLERVC